MNVPKCGPECPECGGNGFIGGDTQSPWSCTVYTRRYRRAIDAEYDEKKEKAG